MHGCLPLKCCNVGKSKRAEKLNQLHTIEVSTNEHDSATFYGNLKKYEVTRANISRGCCGGTVHIIRRLQRRCDRSVTTNLQS